MLGGQLLGISCLGSVVRKSVVGSWVSVVWRSVVEKSVVGDQLFNVQGLDSCRAANLLIIYCFRYMKCLQTGMKREAVQEERSRGKEASNNASSNGNREMNNGTAISTVKDDQPESTCTSADMPLDRILDAQTKSEMAGEDPGQNFNHQEFNATGGDPNSSIFAQIVEFAKNLPLFADLNLETQVLRY